MVLRAAAAAIVLATATTACRPAADALRPGPGARQRADHLFGALAARFTDVDREPKYAAARARLIKGALTPSKIVGDTTVWTGGTAVTRTLLIGGGLEGGRYRLVATPTPPRPSKPGDTQHVIALTRLDEDEFHWFTSVDFSLGQAGAKTVTSVIGELLTSAEGRSEGELRTQYRTAFPRTAAALGVLATIDSLRPTPLPDGSTALSLVIRLHPDQVAKRHPALASYLRKYVETGRMRAALRDAGGAAWLLTEARDNRIRVQLRIMDGELVSLAGGTPARAMPDSMQLEMDLFARVKIFTVGVTRLQTDFVRTRSATEHAWTVTARREPEWHLPLASARLLRAPLARPFKGRGALFQIGVRDENGQTLLFRRAEMTVQESAILRFLGSIGATMAGDFSGRVEKEEQEFLHGVFSALWADARALAE